MLIWFMHGASVRHITYADPLRDFLIQQFSFQDLPLPEFYPCFWGDALGSNTQLWDWVQQDLAAFRWEHPQVDVEDIFHYPKRREQLVSGFFSDIFTYLNAQRGREVRKAIASQFLTWLQSVPFEEDLHIVAHSLSSVILWDILFSDQFAPGDPAFYIRDVIKGLSGPGSGRKVKLRSITTLGSPLLFFNHLLDIEPAKLQTFASRYLKEPLRWVNIIHASDVFAYPIRSSFMSTNDGLDISGLEQTGLYLQDHYLGDRNFLKRNAGDLALALSVVTDHSRYWRSRRVGNLVLANLTGDYTTLSMVAPILEFGEED